MNKVISILLLLTLSSLLCAQTFDINKFSNPEKYKWKDPNSRTEFREDLLERQKLLQIYNLQAQPISKNMMRSAVVPGWGHFVVKEYTKGQVFLGIEIILAGSSLYFYDKAQSNFKKYEDATQIDLINKYYDDATTPFNYSMAFLGLYCIVWAYNIYDTMQSTEEFNATEWKQVIDKYGTKKVTLTPAGISVRF